MPHSPHDGSRLTSSKVTRPYSHSPQTYSLSSPLHSQKYRKVHWRTSIYPPSQQPPHLFCSNEPYPRRPRGRLHLLLKFHSHPPTPCTSILFPPLTSPPNLPLGGTFTLHLHHHHT